jgi:hypothetical protein
LIDIGVTNEFVPAAVRAGLEEMGLAYRLGNGIVTYADDLAIICKRSKAKGA